MNTVTFTVPNISCKHCTHTISMELSDLDGVSNVVADLESKKVTVQFDAPASEETIKDTLAEINYPAEA
ncbi:cation transporter [bacterium]|nr:cation transporter [bacterium]